MPLQRRGLVPRSISRLSRSTDFNERMKRPLVLVLLAIATIIVLWRWHSAARPTAPVALGTAPSAPRSEPRFGSMRASDAAGANAPIAPVPASTPGPAVPGVSPAMDVVQPPPVKEVLDQLRPAADLGDPQAACRVALEMRRCGEMFALSRIPPDNPGYAEFQHTVQAREKLCAGCEVRKRGRDPAHGRQRRRGEQSHRLRQVGPERWKSQSVRNAATARAVTSCTAATEFDHGATPARPSKARIDTRGLATRQSARKAHLATVELSARACAGGRTGGRLAA